MSEDQQYWSRLNAALSGFCISELKEAQRTSNALVDSAVGSELEWCGSQTLLFMTADLFSSHNKIGELEAEIKALQMRLLHEGSAQALLKKQLKDVSTAAEDTSWALQEKLSRLSAQNESLADVNATQQIRLKECSKQLKEGRPLEKQKLEERLNEAYHRISSLEMELFAKERQFMAAKDVPSYHGREGGGGFGRLSKENLEMNQHRAEHDGMQALGL